MFNFIFIYCFLALAFNFGTLSFQWNVFLCRTVIRVDFSCSTLTSFLLTLFKLNPSVRPSSQLYYPPPPGNYIQNYVKVLWMWPFPASSPWTPAATHHLLPPPLIRPPPRPPRSPPTPAPHPNCEGLFTWALSLDCKHTNIPLGSSLLEALSRSVLTPKLFHMSSTCHASTCESSL